MEHQRHSATQTRRANTLLIEGLRACMSAALLARALGVAPATVRAWRRRAGAMSPRNRKRLEQFVRVMRRGEANMST
jgi:hypothetical protein